MFSKLMNSLGVGKKVVNNDCRINNLLLLGRRV